MNNILYFKYYLLLLLSLHVSSFNLISSYPRGNRIVNCSIRNVKMCSNSPTNSYLDTLNKKNIKNNEIDDKLQTNNLQNMTLSSNTNTNTIKLNTLFFNIYNIYRFK